MALRDERLVRWLLVGLMGVGLGCGAEGDGTTGSSAVEVVASEPPVDRSPLGEGWGRPAAVSLPTHYTPRDSWPLVMLLHGYGATGFIQDNYLKVSARVDEDGFILVIPEGTVNGQDKQFWNATSACCDFFRQQPDDVGYLKGLVEEASARYSVDPARVYLIGHSNGGFMSYRMACEAGDIIAGIASLAGSGFLSEASCAGNEPVTVLQIHGTEDGTISYGGSEYFPGAVHLVERWRTRNKCAELTPRAAIGIESTIRGNETTVQEASGCQGGTGVALWTIEGGSHIPVVEPDFARLTLEFLFAHRKPGG